MCEFLKLAYQTYAFNQDTMAFLATASRLCLFTRENYGDRSFELSEALYLNAKANMSKQLLDSDKALDLVREGISIELNKPLTESKSDLHLAMMYLLKASIRREQNKYREAIKCYQHAVQIIS